MQPMFKASDRNNDGLDFQEFLHMIEQASKIED